MILKESRNYVATPPGKTIREQLEYRTMSQKEFAARMDMSEKHISKLINGEVLLTSDMAVRLEMVLGLPAQFWNNLEAVYREKLVKVKNENEMDADIELIRKFPYAEIAKSGWVPATRNVKEKVINLRKYFEVVNLGLVTDSRLNRIACRRTGTSEKADYALLTWAQEAKLQAREIKTEPVNIKALGSQIPAIRDMTVRNPEEFCPELINILSECGIALVFLPQISGSFLHGATFRDGNKIVIGMTVRGKDTDRFWFSLFHELAHVLYSHINQPEGTSEKDEAEADAYAEETLLPKDHFDAFLSKNDFSEKSIMEYAESENINTGIVVGRLQRERLIAYSQFNNLKTRYVISE